LLNNPEDFSGDFPDIVADASNITVKNQLMRPSLIVKSTRCYSDASAGVVDVTATAAFISCNPSQDSLKNCGSDSPAISLHNIKELLCRTLLQPNLK